MKKYSHAERFAITTSNERGVEVWSAPSIGCKRLKVFQNKDGEKSILASDYGHQWKWEAKQAPYCEYMQIWFGSFPWSSYCWAIRRCKVTGKVTVQTLHTEINPRGETECDTWVNECKSYVPEEVKADCIA